MSSGWDSDYRYEASPNFQETFRCFPFDKYKNPTLETGNKIIMPLSSLVQLQTLPVRYPLLFKIEGYTSDKISHCGVLEFCAEEGCVYMPRWMMTNLHVEEGDDVILRDTTLSRGCYMKLQPHEAAFVELSNPKAVLERSMRGFSCLSTGDTIMVRHNDRDFYLDVLDVWPGGEAISLVDTDCMLDFAPPLDYEEPAHYDERDDHDQMIKKVDNDVGGEEREEEVKTFRPFTGVAWRLDGTVVMVESGGCSAVVGGGPMEGGKKREKDGGKEEGKEKFEPFTGRGRVLGGSFFDSN
ncbi:hypothetical protein C2S53_009287 [Perilla frutescens var. hirtella]|uniref:Uncharacterized protein n=1 Tax=Perilla frutescens var. hirtella TaxID=608512 RepID=A0AAD4JCA1_PERFH|nr:hypothetical protein C2S53_009287 [Perilla frutescens var. hirtella]